MKLCTTSAPKDGIILIFCMFFEVVPDAFILLKQRSSCSNKGPTHPRGPLVGNHCIKRCEGQVDNANISFQTAAVIQCCFQLFSSCGKCYPLQLLGAGACNSVQGKLELLLNSNPGIRNNFTSEHTSKNF